MASYPTSGRRGLDLFSRSSGLLERNPPSQDQNLSAVQRQVDEAVGSFADQAKDWKSLAAMVAGGMANRLGKIGVMGAGGLPLRIISEGIGLSTEVTAFEATHRSLSQLAGEGHLNPNLWKWSGTGGIQQGWISSFVTFGTLKGLGKAAEGQNLILQHGAQDVGMVLGHQLLYQAGIGPKPEGTLTEQFFHAEATNLTLAAGMALGHSLTGGRMLAIERGLDLFMQSSSDKEFPSSHGVSLGDRDLVPLGPKIGPEEEKSSLIYHMSEKKPPKGKTGTTGSVRPKEKGPSDKKSFRMDSFLPFLERGIRDERDLEQADEFFKALDPEDAGMISAATQKIPHHFQSPVVGATGGVRLGKTQITFSQVVDRKEGGAAKEIGLSLIGEKGSDPLTVIHERIHAADFKDLPKEYQEVPLPPIPRNGPLKETYRAILENLLWDEALAFGGMVRLAETFKEKTGRDIYEVSSPNFSKEEFLLIQKAYQEGGFQGIYEWVEKNPAYLPYKMGALYMALLAKEGAKDFPQWGEIMEKMGLGKGPEGLRGFFQNHLGPLLRRHGFNLALSLHGLSANEGLLLGQVLRYAAGLMGSERASEFLAKDFDEAVRVLGGLLGDSLREKKGGSPPLKPLPPRPNVLKPGDPKQIQDEPEKTADKVEVLGPFVKILHQIERSSDREVVQSLEAYLTYAEHADPESAARVYSRLLSLAEQTAPDDFYGSLGNRRELLWKLGLSLTQSGYREEGRRILSQTLDKMGPSYWDESHFLDPIHLNALTALGCSDLLETYVAKTLTELQSQLLDPRSLAALKEFLLAGVVVESSGPLIHIRQPRIIIDDRDPNTKVIHALTHLILNAQGEGLSPDLNEKIDQTLRSIWAHLKDEMEKTPSDSQTGMNYYGSPLFEGHGFISKLLKIPGLYRQGLAFLKELPPNGKKRELYWEAAQNLPKDFGDAERLELAKAYEDSFQNNDRSLLDPYAHTAPAQVLLESSDPELQRKGREKLLRLPEDTGGLTLMKARSLIKWVEKFPPDEREVVLCSAHRLLLTSIGRAGMYGEEREILDVVFEIFQKALEYNEKELVRQVSKDAVEMLKLQKSSPLIGADTRNENEVHHLFLCAVQEGDEGIRVLRERIERDVRGGRGRFSLRGILKGVEILNRPEIARRFSDPEKIVCTLARLSIELYIQSIGKKQGEGYFNDRWAPLVKTLRELKISPSAKDELFAIMIERATPEAGVFFGKMPELGLIWQGYEQMDFVLGNPETPKAEALLINRIARLLRIFPLSGSDLKERGILKVLQWAFPRIADSALLDPAHQNDLAALRKEDAYQENLHHLYSFLHDKGFEGDPVKIRASYEEAVERKDRRALTQYQKEIASVLSKDLEKTKGKEGDFYSAHPPGNATAKGFLGKIYGDWKQACKAGDQKLAEALFELWVPSPDEKDAKQKSSLYYEQLAERPLSVEAKRKIFKELTKAESLTRATLKVWEEFVQKGEWIKEEAFYLIVAKARNGERDRFATLLEEESPQEASDLAERYLRFKETGKLDFNHFIDWQIYWAVEDTTGVSSLLAVLACLKGDRLEDLKKGKMPLPLTLADADSLGFSPYSMHTIDPESLGKYPKEIEEIFERDVKPFLNKYYFGAGVIPKEVQKLLGTFENLPTGEEAGKLLENFEPLARRHIRREDKIKMAGFEMPDLFKDRDPLTQFLLSRYFLNLPIGEQQTLLREVKDARPEEALRIFFEKTGLEKVGQFLSFWPEVPEKVRAELVHLQDKVEKSDFEEVRETLRNQLGHYDREFRELVPFARHSMGSASLFTMHDMMHFVEDGVLAPPAGRSFNIADRAPSPKEDDITAVGYAHSSKDENPFSAWVPPPEGIPDGAKNEEAAAPASEGISPETKNEDAALPFKKRIAKIGPTFGPSESVPLGSIYHSPLTSLKLNIENDVNEAVSKYFQRISNLKDESTLTQADFEAIQKNLEPEPLGSGSIGECYRSKLADGTPVVVKIIPPSKEKKFREALERAKALAPLLELYAEEIPGVREAHRLLKMFIEMVEKELDLSQEAENAERVREKLPEGFAIPKILHAQKKILIQEYVKGKKIGSIEDPALRKEIIEKIRAIFLVGQVIGDGFYHSDLQPGNILYDEETRTIWFLDFGQVGELTEAHRDQIIKFIGAAYALYPEGIVRRLEEMAEKQSDYRREELVQAVQQIFDARPQMTPESLSDDLAELFRKSHDAGLWIDLPYLQLIKGIATFEATAKTAHHP